MLSQNARCQLYTYTYKEMQCAFELDTGRAALVADLAVAVMQCGIRNLEQAAVQGSESLHFWQVNISAYVLACAQLQVL